MSNQPLEAQQKPLEVQQKKELLAKGEKTVPARYYVPSTDIFETDEALILVMEVPGVDRKNVEVRLENDELKIEARIDFSNYDGMEPVYTEYNVGHFARTFTLPQVIDQSNIGASISEGVLTLTLKKVQRAQPRKIEIK